MNDPHRLVTVTEGQLRTELRRRVQSDAHTDQLRRHPRLDQLAAFLDGIGEPCWAAGPTATALHGADGCELRPPFHAVIPRGRNVRRLGHVIHTTERLERIDLSSPWGIPATSPTRTLIDLAADLDPARLTVVLDSFLRDRLTSDDFLHRRIAALRGKGVHGIPKLLAVIEGVEITRGGQSFLEREFLRCVSAAGLPRPLTQAGVSKRRDRLIRVDFWWTGTPVVAETLGYRWHSTTAQIASDTARLNRLLLDGKIPLQFTYDRVMHDASGAMTELAEALAPYRRAAS